MNNYNVNFKKMALMLLPTFMRQQVIAFFTYAIVAPLNYLHAQFVAFRTDTNYRLTHNGQVCHLRAVLNDTFDPDARRITITDTDKTPRGMVIYLRELDLEKLAPRRGEFIMIANRRGFSGVAGFDFLVNVPYALSRNLDIFRLKAVVSTYKLASKRFAINYI